MNYFNGSCNSNYSIDELHKAFDHFKKTNDERLKEIEKKGFVDPLIQEKIDRIHDHIDLIETKQIALQRQEVSDFSGMAFKNKNEELDYKYFLEYMTKGNSSNLENFRQNNLEFKNAEQLISASGSGAFLINSYLNSQIIDRVQFRSALRKFANVVKVSGNLNEYIQCLENFKDGGWVDEMDNRAVTETPEISKITIKLYEMYAQPRVTQQILFDSVLNLESWIIDKIADSFRILENDAFLFGDGANKPLGLFKYNSDIANKIKIEELLIPNARSAPSAAKNLTLDNLLNLMYLLDSEYLENASWLMSPNALRVIRGLKDATSGVYLWQPAFEKSSPSSLLGHPIGLSRDLPIGDQSGQQPIAFGDFKKGFIILDSDKNVFIRDQYTFKPFISFYFSKRVGASVVNPNAIKIMKITDPV
jgi:HK97 family phage major capsid protein